MFGKYGLHPEKNIEEKSIAADDGGATVKFREMP